MYKRQIAFGGAASVAFLAAGVLAAGTAYASTTVTLPGGVPNVATAALSSGTSSPSAVIPALPSLSQLRGVVQNGVVPEAHSLAPTTQGVVRQAAQGSPGATNPVSLPMQPASVLAGLASAVPGLSTASGLLGSAGVAPQLSGSGAAPNGGTSNVVSTPEGGISELPHAHLGNNSVGQSAKSAAPGELSGALNGLNSTAGHLPIGIHLPAVG